MNIGFLVEYACYKEKLSRIRFEYGNAIGKALKPSGNLVWLGNGWPKYDVGLSLKNNLKYNYQDINFDLIIAFKPSKHRLVPESSVPICIAYNESWDVEETLTEIKESNAKLVIFHHYSDYLEYVQKYPLIGVTYKFIPHSADESVFKKYEHNNAPYPKLYDCLVVGATNVHTKFGRHYPLRDKLVNVMDLMPKKYKCGVYLHPSGRVTNADEKLNVIDFAKAINCTKIALTCSGVPRSRFGKYIEIPMCGTAIAADMFEDEPMDMLKTQQHLIRLDLSMSEHQIINILTKYLDNEDKLSQVVKNGLEYVKEYTLEKYAERFITIVKEFIIGNA